MNGGQWFARIGHGPAAQEESRDTAISTELLAGRGSAEETLSDEAVAGMLSSALADAPLAGLRVLVLVPDGTRSAPIPLMFHSFNEQLAEKAAALDYLIALGTVQA